MTIGAQKQSEDNGNSDREGESFDRGGKQPTFFFGFSLCRFAATIVASVAMLAASAALVAVDGSTVQLEERVGGPGATGCICYILVALICPVL